MPGVINTALNLRYSCKYFDKFLVTNISPIKTCFVIRNLCPPNQNIHHLYPTTISNEINTKLFLDESAQPGPSSFHPPGPGTSKIYLHNHIFPEAYLLTAELVGPPKIASSKRTAYKHIRQ
jgi:hypothetical protein